MGDQPLFLKMQFIGQIILCLYGARESYWAITNLRKYEATTKKLAKWSKEVENQLWKTRKTQATGALTVAFSFVTATILAFFSSSLHRYAYVGLPPVVLGTLLFARSYIKRFWAPATDKDGKSVGTKVPLPNLEDYNVAVRSTEQLLSVLEYLEYSVVASIVVQGLAGFSAS